MNSLIRLRTDDFSIQQGNKGPLLCLGIKGIALVFFWSPGCKICSQLEPEFRQLPQIINDVKFCLCNINENQNVIRMAKETIAPIQFVPYISLYINGRPFLQYDDAPNLEQLVNFVQYSLKLVENKKSFINKGAKVESNIPKFSLGRPYAEFKCDEKMGVCYLAFNDAYPKAKSASSGGGLLQESSNEYFKRS